MKVGVLRSGELVAIVDGRVAKLAPLAPGEESFRDLGSFLSGGDDTAAAARAALGEVDLDQLEAPPADEVSFGAPYVHGAKIVCHVVNYPGHATGVGPPSQPYFFTRAATTVLANGEPIEAHARMSRELDWETELAFVIGRTARDVRAEDAYDHIAGFTILNDVSHREYQFNKLVADLRPRFGMNWTQGKGLDASCPIGPWIVLRDELPDPYPLRVRTYVNGKLRQDASTSEMVHKIPALLAEITRGMTFNPGDIISTGSPGGAALENPVVD
jgi:2-keto-4-pentenoate hydratase/2-oxohepta-3-ene-1,7-dioic acid hydratase in catechol pathway